MHAAVRANRRPLARAEYADGSAREIGLKNLSAREVAAALQRLRDSASGVGRSFKRPVATRTPSVQGAWDPSLSYEGFAMRESRRPLPPPPSPPASAGASAEALA